MTMGPLDLPIDAQAFSLPYEITAPLDADELDFTPDGIAYLEVNTASHLGKWLLGFSTPGDRPRRVLEARTTGPGTSEQAYATAGLALAAEGGRHGLVLAAAANRNGERPADERATMLYAVYALARGPQPKCCAFHDAPVAEGLSPERCAPDEQGGYCCDDCPTLRAAAVGDGT